MHSLAYNVFSTRLNKASSCRRLRHSCSVLLQAQMAKNVLHLSLIEFEKKTSSKITGFLKFVCILFGFCYSIYIHCRPKLQNVARAPRTVILIDVCLMYTVSQKIPDPCDMFK